MTDEQRQHKANMLKAMGRTKDPENRRFLMRCITDYENLEQLDRLQRHGTAVQDDADEMAVWQGDLGSRDLVEEE